MQIYREQLFQLQWNSLAKFIWTDEKAKVLALNQIVFPDDKRITVESQAQKISSSLRITVESQVLKISSVRKEDEQVYTCGIRLLKDLYEMDFYLKVHLREYLYFLK